MGNFPVTISVLIFTPFWFLVNFPLSMAVLQCSQGRQELGPSSDILLDFVEPSGGGWQPGSWLHEFREVAPGCFPSWKEGPGEFTESQISLVPLILVPPGTLTCCLPQVPRLLFSFLGHKSGVSHSQSYNGNFIIPCSHPGISFRGVQWERNKGVLKKT